MIVKSYRELIVWQKALDFADAVYEVTRRFPKEETYGLTSQLRRSAVSIASNIAEGAGRHGTGEFLQFLGIARGSLAEAETQLFIANRQSYFNQETLDALLEKSEHISRLLSGLVRSLQ